MIGDLAVNCHVPEPVYTLDIEIVVNEAHRQPVSGLVLRSKLRIQFTTDERHRAFLTR